MQNIYRLIIALPLLLVTPVAAQDILGPLQDFVDTLTDPPAQAPTRPAAPKPPEAEPPPVPIADRSPRRPRERLPGALWRQSCGVWPG